MGLLGRQKMSYELLWSYFVDTYAVLKSNEAITDFFGRRLILATIGRYSVITDGDNCYKFRWKRANLPY